MQKDFFVGGGVGTGSVSSVTLTQVGASQTNLVQNDELLAPPIDETGSANSPRMGEKDMRDSTNKV